MKTVSVILPCYNEEESLPLYFQAVDEVIKDIDNYSFKFILVNDGSKDNTVEVMNRLYQERNDVELVLLSRNFGQNPAIYAGLSTVDTDYAIAMDVDLQDPVELLKDICEKFDEGYDVVSPHREDRSSDTLFKRTTAKMFYSLVNKLEGKKVIPENVNAFRGLSRRAVDLINSFPNKDRFFLIDVAFVGLRTCYIDFSRQKRSAGESKYSLSKLFNHAFNLISTGTARPLYLLIEIGALCTAFWTLAFLAFLITYICMSAGAFDPCGSAQGAISTFFIISAVFLALSILIFLVGVLGIYLHNILINTRDLPLYIIDRNIKQEDKQK